MNSEAMRAEIERGLRERFGSQVFVQDAGLGHTEDFFVVYPTRKQSNAEKRITVGSRSARQVVADLVREIDSEANQE